MCRKSETLRKLATAFTHDLNIVVVSSSSVQMVVNVKPEEWLRNRNSGASGDAADALVWLCRHVSPLLLDHDFKSKIAKRFHSIHPDHPFLYIMKMTKASSTETNANHLLQLFY